MKKFIAIASVLAGFSASAQTILITDADLTAPNYLDCSTINPGTNFYDSGGTGADYSPNEVEEITICPDPAGGTKVIASFGTLAGFTWDVDGSDTLYVYDGPNTSSPLLGAHNSVTDPTGFTHVASFANNPSGCLTFRFVSDGANEGTGWDAKVNCTTPPQPFDVHMEAYINGDANGANDMVNDQSPVDTGYVDVCFGDSIMFVALPDFPYDPTSGNTNGGGYDQVGNYSVSWDFSDGTTFTGDTVWFTPPARSGYLVTLRVEDAYPQIEGLLGKVRVSTIPSFATCAPVDDTLCVGSTTELIGGVTATDTAGVDPTSSAIELGGSFAGVTFLPDGNGTNYTTDIQISGFPVGDTVSSATDLASMCVSIEHSFLGDLEMMLTCPNGTSVNIFNSYNGANAGQLFPGGFGGGGIFLGEAWDGTTQIGNCWTYCFYDNAPNPPWAANLPTTPVNNPTPGTAVTAGDYQPEQSFGAFVGCPLNGTWTLTVRDSWSSDDGWICEWGIAFDPSINPNSETYSPFIATEQWLSSPTIVSGGSDTAVVVQPDTAGPHNYTFEVTDNFGCVYDTTITVTAIPGPSILPDTIACDNEFQIFNTFAPEGGTWTQISGTGTSTFTPSNTFINPNIQVDSSGLYVYEFVDNQCGQTLPIEIEYLVEPTVMIEDSVFFCEGDEFLFDATFTASPVDYDWLPGGEQTPMLTVTQAGEYIVTLSNYCGTDSDSSIVVTDPCSIIIPNVFTPNNDGVNDVFVVDGVERYPNTLVQIFNRWGQLIYENADYDNSWDGTTPNGTPVSDGTYYYVVQYVRLGEEVNEAGTVNVFRNQ